MIFASEIWGAFFLEGLFLGGGGLVIGILRYKRLNKTANMNIFPLGEPDL